jgi:acyl carrier protein
MTREAIEAEIRRIFLQEFEIEDPAMDADLREAYQFDSIDAIELLVEIERFLGSELTMEEKKKAMDIRTVRQICVYVEDLVRIRRPGGSRPIGDLCKEGS